MSTYYISPSGLDTNDGLSEATPKRTFAALARTWGDTFPAGHAVLWQKGGVYLNDPVQLWGGDPEKPLKLGAYGHDSGVMPYTDRPVLVSEGRPAIEIYGAGGVEIRDLVLKGDDRATVCDGLVWGNLHDQFNVPARHVVIERLEVSGFGHGGIVATTGGQPVHGLVLRDLHVHHNAIGLRVGHGDPKVRNMFAVLIERVLAEENDREGLTDAGYGIELSALVGSTIRFCKAIHNTIESSSPGHGGIILHYCDDSIVQDCYAARNYNAVHGDGQGICLLGCKRCHILDCLSYDNWYGDFNFRSEITDEAAGKQEWPCEGCSLRNSTSLNGRICLHMHGQVWDCEVSHCLFTTIPITNIVGEDDYRVVLVISTNPVLDAAGNVIGHEEGPRDVRIYGNLFRAQGNALLAGFDTPASLRGLAFAEHLEMVNDWEADFGLPVVCQGLPDMDSLTAALLAWPVATQE